MVLGERPSKKTQIYIGSKESFNIFFRNCKYYIWDILSLKILMGRDKKEELKIIVIIVLIYFLSMLLK